MLETNRAAVDFRAVRVGAVAGEDERTGIDFDDLPFAGILRVTVVLSQIGQIGGDCDRARRRSVGGVQRVERRIAVEAHARSGALGANHVVRKRAHRHTVREAKRLRIETRCNANAARADVGLKLFKPCVPAGLLGRDTFNALEVVRTGAVEAVGALVLVHADAAAGCVPVYPVHRLYIQRAVAMDADGVAAVVPGIVAALVKDRTDVGRGAGFDRQLRGLPDAAHVLVYEGHRRRGQGRTVPQRVGVDRCCRRRRGRNRPSLRQREVPVEDGRGRRQSVAGIDVGRGRAAGEVDGRSGEIDLVRSGEIHLARDFGDDGRAVRDRGDGEAVRRDEAVRRRRVGDPHRARAGDREIADRGGRVQHHRRGSGDGDVRVGIVQRRAFARDAVEEPVRGIRPHAAGHAGPDESVAVRDGSVRPGQLAVRRREVRLVRRLRDVRRDDAVFGLLGDEDLRALREGTGVDKQATAVSQRQIAGEGERPLAFHLAGESKAVRDLQPRTLRDRHGAGTDRIVRGHAQRTAVHRRAARIFLHGTGRAVVPVRHHERPRAGLRQRAGPLDADAARHRVAGRVDRQRLSGKDPDAPVRAVGETEELEVVRSRNRGIDFEPPVVVLRQRSHAARADDEVGDEGLRDGVFAFRDARSLDRADVAAASETRHVGPGRRLRAHDHFLGHLKRAVDVDVAAIPSIRDGGEAGVAGLLHAEDAVVGYLKSGKVLPAHDGVAGDNPRIVAQVVDDPVLGEGEGAVERAVRSGRCAQRGIGVRRRRAAGELHRTRLLHVVRTGEVDGAVERHVARARVGDSCDREGVCARECDGSRRVEGELADGCGGIDGDFRRVVDDQFVVRRERAGGRGRPVGGIGQVPARAAVPGVGIKGQCSRSCKERTGKAVREESAVHGVVEADHAVRFAFRRNEVEAEVASGVAQLEGVERVGGVVAEARIWIGGMRCIETEFRAGNKVATRHRDACHLCARIGEGHRAGKGVEVGHDRVLRICTDGIRARHRGGIAVEAYLVPDHEQRELSRCTRARARAEEVLVAAHCSWPPNHLHLVGTCRRNAGPYLAVAVRLDELELLVLRRQPVAQRRQRTRRARKSQRNNTGETRSFRPPPTGVADKFFHRFYLHRFYLH